MRRVLIAVCGITPQVITETLFGLRKQGVFPDELLVLTTPAGLRRCKETLLGETGMLTRFQRDFPDTGGMFFSEAQIHIPASTSEDILTEEDSRLFLELCMHTVFMLSEQPDTELIFSVAGGRKTMGVSLALAAQCYARMGDMMFHVLVPAAYESSSFFYPRPFEPPVPVQLIPVPFLRVRPFLSPDQLDRPRPAQSLLEGASLYPYLLRIDIKKHQFLWGERLFSIQPAPCALYLFFILRKIFSDCAGSCPPGCHTCALSCEEVLQRASLLDRLRDLTGGGRERMERFFDAETFLAYKARIHQVLRKSMGEEAPGVLGVVSFGKRPNMRYSLALSRDRLVLPDSVMTTLRNLYEAYESVTHT